MIMKLLQGGNAIPPLLSYLPVTVTGAPEASVASTRSSSTSDSSTDLTDKDLLKMLGDLDGLPSDMAVLTNALLNFYIDLSYSPFPDTSNIASRYLLALNLMKVAKFNHELFNDAMKTVSLNGGINEFAITDRGLLFCVNSEGDFQLFSPEELKDNSEYKPLTNSELLNYRAHSPELANNNELIRVVKNGIGIESVTKMITDIASKIGTEKTTELGYYKTAAGRLVSGLEDFTKAVDAASGLNYDGSLHDLYKLNYLTEDLYRKALEAMNYIYRALPENAKTLLKIKSDDFSDQGAIKLISSLLTSQLDSTREFNIDLVGGKTKQKETKASLKDDTDLKTSLPLDLMLGNAGYLTTLGIDRGDGIKLLVNGSYVLQIKDTKGEPIINTSLLNMLANSGLLSIVKNTRNITFGDLKLSEELLANITYNNTGIMRANLPVNSDGTVRTEILEDYFNAKNEIELLGENPSKEQVLKIYHKYDLDELVKPNGDLNEAKFAPFLVTEGYTTSLNGITESDFVKEIDNPTDLLIKLILESLAIGTEKNKEVPEIDLFNWINPADWFGWYDDIYKAAIYIPITNNIGAAVRGANLNLDYDEALELEKKYRNFDKVTRYNPIGDEVL